MEMERFLLIKADTNDGDYISEKSKISDVNLEKVREIVKALRESNKVGQGYRRRIRWETGECGNPYEYATKGILTMDEIEFFNDFLPHGEHGIHTIESIEIVYQGEKLL